MMVHNHKTEAPCRACLSVSARVATRKRAVSDHVHGRPVRNSCEDCGHLATVRYETFEDDGSTTVSHKCDACAWGDMGVDVDAGPCDACIAGTCTIYS